MYIDTINNRYPLFPGDVALEVPGWVLGDPLPEGWYQVTQVGLPELGPNQTFYEKPPVVVDGEYLQVWDVRTLTEEEIQASMAPFTARQKLKTVVGLTDAEIDALIRGLR